MRHWNVRMTHSAVGPMRNVPAWRGRVVSAVLCLVFSAMPGCAHWIELSTLHKEDEPVRTLSVQADERVPVFLSAAQVSRNGTPIDMPADFERQVLSELRQTQLFSEHFQQGYSQPVAGEKFVTVRLSLRETIDPRAGEAAWKGFLIGASMFALTPILPLSYDYESLMTLDVERWDGMITHYSASAKGTAFYQLFGATPLVIQELKGQVTEACFTQLMQQLVQDTGLYLARSAPLPTVSSPTITVKAKPAHSLAVPTSTLPPPPTQ